MAAKPKELIQNLPMGKGWTTQYLHQYQGFWYSEGLLQGLLTLQQKHNAPPSPHPNVLLVTSPKCGTTWLKAILFAITNRSSLHDYQTDHPLLNASPHECVPFIETHANDNPKNPIPKVPVLATHIPYSSLPKSIIESTSCKVVYVSRDPKDVFVSLWHSIKKVRLQELQPLSMEDAFELFSKGVSPYGPFWDHVVGYWRASLEQPERVLFLKYEEMKSEPVMHAKKLAEFLGKPFSLEEEEEGDAERIVDMCSFERLSNLEVNKSGRHHGHISTTISNNSYFRKGVVGD